MPNDTIAKWITEHYKGMRRFATKLVGPEGAEDLLHTACEAALKKGINPEDVGKPKQWLNGIVYWTFRGMLQSSQIKHEVLMPDEFMPVGTALPTQEYAADIDRAMRALEFLSPERQRAIWLVVLNEHTLAEAAAELDVSKQAVAQMIAGAKKSLLKIVSQDNALRRKPSPIVGRGPTISEAQAREIFDRANRGESQAQIARDFGVSQQTVSMIKRKKLWKHIHVE